MNLKLSNKNILNRLTYKYIMKKIILVSAVAITFLLTSCSSGWSCQKRYCNAKQVKTKTIEQKKNA
ncbi:hypothetical protein FBBAL38_07300 [Flavobacteria bacterium BAL38]|nr:hypothetical protein FBBAL38_07300 [Flavobacteria bacterium BAL38]